MPATSGTTAVATGATTVTVSGSFSTNYQVTVSPNWVTTFSVTSKLTGSFLVTFGVPAPAGSSIDWTVAGVATAGTAGTTLTTFLTYVRELLRDETKSLYSDGDLTDFINWALQQRDLELGLNRARIAYTLIANQFDYAISTIVANGTVIVGPASPNVIDPVSIIIVPLGTATAGIRYPLGRWPYSRLAYLLSTSYPTYPVKYAVYGTTDIVLAPPPAGAYPAEFDFTVYAPKLAQGVDADPLGYPYSDPIPFLAAHFAKLQAQRFDEAESFLKIYRDRLNMVRARSRPFAISDPFADLPRGAR